LAHAEFVFSSFDLYFSFLHWFGYRTPEFQERSSDITLHLDRKLLRFGYIKENTPYENLQKNSLKNFTWFDGCFGCRKHHTTTGGGFASTPPSPDQFEIYKKPYIYHNSLRVFFIPIQVMLFQKSPSKLLDKQKK